MKAHRGRMMKKMRASLWRSGEHSRPPAAAHSARTLILLTAIPSVLSLCPTSLCSDRHAGCIQLGGFRWKSMSSSIRVSRPRQCAARPDRYSRVVLQPAGSRVSRLFARAFRGRREHVTRRPAHVHQRRGHRRHADGAAMSSRSPSNITWYSTPSPVFSLHRVGPNLLVMWELSVKQVTAGKCRRPISVRTRATKQFLGLLSPAREFRSTCFRAQRAPIEHRTQPAGRHRSSRRASGRHALRRLNAESVRRPHAVDIQ